MTINEFTCWVRSREESCIFILRREQAPTNHKIEKHFVPHHHAWSRPFANDQYLNTYERTSIKYYDIFLLEKLTVRLQLELIRPSWRWTGPSWTEGNIARRPWSTHAFQGHILSSHHCDGWPPPPTIPKVQDGREWIKIFITSCGDVVYKINCCIYNQIMLYI
jgi:hypothetical protein